MEPAHLEQSICWHKIQAGKTNITPQPHEIHKHKHVGHMFERAAPILQHSVLCSIFMNYCPKVSSSSVSHVGAIGQPLFIAASTHPQHQLCRINHPSRSKHCVSTTYSSHMYLARAVERVSIVVGVKTESMSLTI